MRKVKIVSDGSPRGTKVVDLLTDEPIPGVRKVELTIDGSVPNEPVMTRVEAYAQIDVMAYMDLALRPMLPKALRAMAKRYIESDPGFQKELERLRNEGPQAHAV